MTSYTDLFYPRSMQSAVGTGGANEGRMNFLQTALDLKERCGWGVFYEGIQPKLLRAAINHSVTFSVYNAVMSNLGDIAST